MVIKTASPGVIVNEVDLTRGTSDAITTNVGGFVGPFARGPVDELVLIETESELQKVFGDPQPENAEYWYTVANFLEYGGVCYVVRCDDESGGSQTMKNAVTNGSAVFIKNYDDFEENYDDGVSLSAFFAARTAGDFGNALGVAIIDAGADDIVKVAKTGQKTSTGTAASEATRPSGGDPGSVYETFEQLKVAAFVAPTAFAAVDTAGGTNVTALTGEQDIGGVTTSTSRVLLTGQTDVSENGIYVTASGAWARAADADASADFQYGKSVVVSGGTNAGTFYYTGSDDPTVGTDNLTFSNTNPTPDALTVGEYVVLGDALGAGAATGFISALDSTGVYVTVAVATGTFVGAIDSGSHLEDASGNEVSGAISAAESYFGTKLYTAIDAADPTLINTIYSPTTYTVAEGNSNFSWTKTPRPRLTAVSTAGITFEYDSDRALWVAVPNLKAGASIGFADTFYTVESVDNWYNQQVAFEGIPWYRFASRPTSSLNGLDRGAYNDAMNIIIYDATGDETGSKGNMLESYFGVSKLKGALTPEGEPNYYLKVINERSGYIYAGKLLAAATGGTLNSGRAAVGATMGAVGDVDYLSNGVEDSSAYPVAGSQNLTFSGGANQLAATIGERQIAYNKFSTENVSILDYLIQGPGGANLEESTAIGNFLINVVEERRDCMCFLSPYRTAVVNQSDSEQITKNVEIWADTLSSSSYAVFDSGYKYMYDRFNDTYIYVPLNGDTAGTVVYTAVEAEPYYSPAGLSRGQIRNVVKLAYNPAKAQRDILYAARVNPVVTFPGEGTVLFGDKTGLAYSSAFDRINVRRLFLVVEREISEIARQNLFEFNDEVTRTLFKNNTNPFLRDIQSKRGMTDFLVVCDETNNPPDIVDRNEFVADIYIKPARSINFVTLNFVATKTGVAFDEAVALFRGSLGNASGAA